MNITLTISESFNLLTLSDGYFKRKSCALVTELLAHRQYLLFVMVRWSEDEKDAVLKYMAFSLCNKSKL